MSSDAQDVLSMSQHFIQSEAAVRRSKFWGRESVGLDLSLLVVRPDAQLGSVTQSAGERFEWKLTQQNHTIGCIVWLAEPCNEADEDH